MSSGPNRCRGMTPSRSGIPGSRPWSQHLMFCEGVYDNPISSTRVAELHQSFWAGWQGGEFVTDASAAAGNRSHASSQRRSARTKISPPEVTPPDTPYVLGDGSLFDSKDP